MPAAKAVPIGSARQMDLSILFLDIRGFTSFPNSTHEEQLTTLALLNIFIGEMLCIVRDYEGRFEKNTGDGLMAYFGTETPTVHEIVRPAAEAAVIMHYVNDYIITPHLVELNLPPIRFRIGIEYGQVTIGRVGATGGLSSLVAIGTAANLACRLMDEIDDGICIGDSVYHNLPDGWDQYCLRLSPKHGYVIKGTDAQYPTWNLTYRADMPIR